MHAKARWFAVTIVVVLIIVSGVGLGLFLRSHDTTAAALGVDPPVVDFGDISRGTLVSKSVRLTNNSRDVLRIRHLVGTCGCVRARLETNTLAPGESSVLQISVQEYSKRSDGQQEWEVGIIAEELLARVPVRFQIKDLPFSTATDVVSFGRVERAQLPAHRTLVVSSPTGQDLKIDKYPAHCKCEMSRNSLEGSSTTIMEVQITLCSSVPSGEFYDHLVLADPNSTTTLPIEVVGYVRGSIYANPSAVLLTSTSEMSGSAIVKFESRKDDAAFTILAATVDTELNASVKVTVSNRSIMLELKDRRSKTQGLTFGKTTRGCLRVKCQRSSDDDDIEVITVPVKVLRS